MPEKTGISHPHQSSRHAAYINEIARQCRTWHRRATFCNRYCCQTRQPLAGRFFRRFSRTQIAGDGTFFSAVGVDNGKFELSLGRFQQRLHCFIVGRGLTVELQDYIARHNTGLLGDALRLYANDDQPALIVFVAGECADAQFRPDIDRQFRRLTGSHVRTVGILLAGSLRRRRRVVLIVDYLRRGVICQRLCAIGRVAGIGIIDVRVTTAVSRRPTAPGR